MLIKPGLVGLREFSKVMQILECILSLHNYSEFLQANSCLENAEVYHVHHLSHLNLWRTIATLFNNDLLKYTNLEHSRPSKTFESVTSRLFWAETSYPSHPQQEWVRHFWSQRLTNYSPNEGFRVYQREYLKWQKSVTFLVQRRKNIGFWREAFKPSG